MAIRMGHGAIGIDQPRREVKKRIFKIVKSAEAGNSVDNGRVD